MSNAEAPAKPKRTFLSRKPISDLLLDGRCRPAKRKRELVEMFAAAVSADMLADPILSQKIEVAAELAVVAEVTRANFLNANASADDVVRTSRAASLAERQLGIDARRKPAKPNVADYLRNRAA